MATVALPHGMGACAIGLNPRVMSPQRTAAPAGLVVTLASHSRPTEATAGGAIDGAAISGGDTCAGAATTGAAALPDCSSSPTDRPTTTQAAYGPARRAIRRARSIPSVGRKARTGACGAAGTWVGMGAANGNTTSGAPAASE